MSRKIRPVLTVLLMSPLITYAHGEEVLIIPFITIVSVLVFSTFMLTVGRRIARKAPLVFTYILATVITYLIVNFIPFRTYENAILLSVALVPVLAVFAAYAFSKKRNNN
ncbi:hypothetical protein [Mucilaginibacter auburnensis]|uniref:Uncharacterized protein n=1 Tax=Mucilaginibacter auburnensis TaxID=1457233 RepID=A0A2H9VTY0_9SPHI|nr:hypothetical protein [Mucilaginibacter auburnensis]PJJ84286.1 hypothetical protein CLV57_1297 [Mucilaginibacter auburnensis]